MIVAFMKSLVCANRNGSKIAITNKITASARSHHEGSRRSSADRHSLHLGDELPRLIRLPSSPHRAVRAAAAPSRA